MDERLTSAEEQRYVSRLVRQLRDVAADEVVSELLGIDPLEVQRIAQGHDFNHDRYSRVTASLGLQPQELRTPKAIEMCNWHMTQLVLKTHGITPSSLANFRGLLGGDRVVSPKEIEDRFMQAGVEYQQSLDI